MQEAAQSAAQATVARVGLYTHNDETGGELASLNELSGLSPTSSP